MAASQIEFEEATRRWRHELLLPTHSFKISQLPCCDTEGKQSANYRLHCTIIIFLFLPHYVWSARRILLFMSILVKKNVLSMIVLPIHLNCDQINKIALRRPRYGPYSRVWTQYVKWLTMSKVFPCHNHQSIISWLLRNVFKNSMT